MATNPATIAHLLRRTGFLSPPDLVAQLAQGTLAEAVDYVLDFSKNPPDDFPTSIPGDGFSTQIRSVNWWFNRMATAPRPLQEKLTLFWHGHFATAASRAGSFEAMRTQNQVLRANAGANFDTLTQAVCLHPALLVYLDNQYNYSYAINENFSRELMELFVLGADQGYTQADVIAMARAWTGHGCNDTYTLYQFDPTRHDYDPKTLFGITRPWDGPETITEMVRGSRSVECSKFISRKLWVFFAGTLEPPYPGIDADLRAANFNIGAFLRTMLNRPEFYTDNAKNGRVKSPMEWLVGIYQAAKVSVPMPANQSAPEANEAFILRENLAVVRHEMFEPPNVSGWKVNDVWLSEAITWGKQYMVERAAIYATSTVLQSLASQPPAQVATELIAAFGIDRVTPGTVSAITQFIAAERQQPTIPEYQALVQVAALTPEFQMA
jgi:uncharacterized protein (DUF1800 family)